MEVQTRRQRRWRIRIETLIASAASALGVLTLLWPAWIEAMTGLDPDRGDGSVEWLLVGALFALSAATAVAACWELRQMDRATPG